MARAQVLRTVLYFGVLIGAVLLALQAATLRGIAAGGTDWLAGIVGFVFLAAGILVGSRFRSSDTKSPPGVDSPLSAREMDVLRGIAQGHSNRTIAENHFVSVNTVKTQVAQIYRKLDAGGRVQAVDRARRMGLIP